MFARLCLIIAGLLLVPGVAFGEMTSTNYYIYADSIGLGGGEISTSTSYTLDNTIADSPGSEATSTSYNIYGGYQGMVLDDSLSLTITTTTINFGTISNSEVTSRETSIIIGCNAITGYTLSMSNVSGSTPTSVSDGAVSAGTSEYGIAVTGPQAAFADDRSVVSGRLIASSSGPVDASTTTVAFKASVASGGVGAGSYPHTITITASANF